MVDEIPTVNSNGILCDQDVYGFNSFTDIEQNELKDKVSLVGFPKVIVLIPLLMTVLLSLQIRLFLNLI